MRLGICAGGTVTWVLLWGGWDLTGVVTGLIISSCIAWIFPPTRTPRLGRIVKKLPQIIGLFSFFLWELLLANLRLVRETLTPGLHIQPSIIALPLDAKTDAEIYFLFTLLALTPDTVCMDVSEDKSVMYLHCAYAKESNIESLKQSIKDGFEKRILEVMR